MCGIAGLISKHKANIVTRLIRMLKNLEYRGYDSCGIAILSDNSLEVHKSKGKIDAFAVKYNIDSLSSYIGIAHTRWATHGAVTDWNAHPHTDCTNNIAVVHNGIIENYLELKEWLISRGHKFTSETDTEVIPHLVEEFLIETKNIKQALQNTVRKLQGTYAFVMLTTYDSNRLYFAKYGQPLIIGLSNDYIYLASDIPAFLEWTNKAIILRDGDIGYIEPNSWTIENIFRPDLSPPVPVDIPWSPQQAKKGGYPHFMLKEIFEQPDALTRTIMMVPKQLKGVIPLLRNASEIYIIAAGTSYYASLYGQYLFAKYGIKTTSVISSEFISIAGNLVDKDTVILAVSQSGETFDTLNAVKYAKQRGAKIIGLVNVIESSLMRMSHRPIVMGAGPEIGVAATKTFLCQVASLALILTEYLKNEGKNHEEMLNELKDSPQKLKEFLPIADRIARDLAQKIKDVQSAFYLGRGLGFPIALEGALKMKEIAYIHAESYPAGESKHGPIALVEKNFPVIEVVLKDENYDNMVTSIEEMKSRNGFIISLHEKGDEKIRSISNVSIQIPHIHIDISPILYIVPLQLLAYHTSVLRGHNPDRPRNLAKSVTVA